MQIYWYSMHILGCSLILLLILFAQLFVSDKYKIYGEQRVAQTNIYC